ncbi:TetR/AcrR family transcriptional regulator C-terminal domain-containing protein [Thalassotalea insulae]|uniref:TetR/AcrR family transcriptional regulator C-terminal domain-containing protein n=1 Tax=Thalassotalea insulae TaxID=2056778 RepID=UPI0024E14CF1|nr:TetR/AcrR family transcriptional regulator C-terminal domain-containing protein [Thalassotalea insulae]
MFMTDDNYRDVWQLLDINRALMKPFWPQLFQMENDFNQAKQEHLAQETAAMFLARYKK